MKTAEESQGKGRGRFYSVAEAAKVAGVSEATIHKWRRQMKIKSHKTDAGHVMIDADDVEAMDSDADTLLEHTTAQLQALFKTRSAAVEDFCRIIAEQRTEIERKEKRISELEQRVSDYHVREMATLKTAEELLTLRHEREMERIHFERDAAMKDAALKKLAPLASGLAARLGYSFPGVAGANGSKASAVVRVVTEIRESFTSAEQEKIFEILGTERARPFRGEMKERELIAAMLNIRDSLSDAEGNALLGVLGAERAMALWNLFDSLPNAAKGPASAEPESTEPESKESAA